jgi:hypothetical protein
LAFKVRAMIKDKIVVYTVVVIFTIGLTATAVDAYMHPEVRADILHCLGYLSLYLVALVIVIAVCQYARMLAKRYVKMGQAGHLAYMEIVKAQS